jgi:hypothetical protein
MDMQDLHAFRFDGVEKQGGYPLLDLAITDVRTGVPLDLSAGSGPPFVVPVAEVKRVAGTAAST